MNAKSVPKTWTKTKLAQLATVQTGLSKSGNRQGKTVSRPYLRVANVQDGYLNLNEIKQIEVPVGQVDRFLLHPGDVLLTEGGDFDKLGRGCMWNGEIDKCVHQNHVFAVRVKDASQVRPDFLALAIQADQSRTYFMSCAKQSTNLASINSSQIKQLPLLLPPTSEQDAIVKLVDLSTCLANTTSSLLRKLELRMHGLMQQLLTGRRRLKGFKGQWRSVAISEFARYSRLVNSADMVLPVLSCTKYNGLVDSLSYFGKQIFSKDISTYKLVRRGQFAYATNHIEEGSIGYQDLYDIALISPMYTVFEADSSVVDHAYLYLLLKTEAMRRVFESTTHASVARRGSLRWPEFSKLKVQLPPLAEQQAITRVLKEAASGVRLTAEQLNQLRAQKRVLMQKLLSGQLRLSTP